jgi:epoxyqueuosine reductase
MKFLEKITHLLGDTNLYSFGYANVEGLLDRQYSDYNYALSIAKKLEDDIVNGILEGPTRQYFDQYNRINNELFALVNELSKILDEEKIKNIPIKPTFEDDELDQSCFETLRTPFSHKMAATRAGLGWIGKTDLLITHRFGPRVRLATVLLHYENLETGNPITASKCGNCTICVDKCPVQAANGKLWNRSIDRNEFFDAHKCRKKCREVTKNKLNEETSLCGICVSVCPMGKKKF